MNPLACLNRLAAKADLERQLNIERERVALLEAEGLG